MSLKTWKKEFYPIPANKVKGYKKAVEHSFLKWKGLLPSNLKKHKVKLDEYHDVVDIDGKLIIDSDSCALCCLAPKDNFDNLICTNCPIVKAHGNECNDGKVNPWKLYMTTNDPQPMLKVLRKVLRTYK